MPNSEPISITPTPTDAEAAAIVAAVTVAWPSVEEPDDRAPVAPRWRFSGRWWNRPAPISRQRPWRA